jgi:hypothetical protein
MASNILLDTSNLEQPRLVVKVPPERQDEIRQILETLENEQVAGEAIVLDALLVAAD